jgi:SAM-dependent MidA family methyltransferase
MVDVMTYLRESHPEVYECTKYTIIEISEALATRQRQRIKEAGLEGKVIVENQDFFDWQGGGEDPCYFVALEVFVSRAGSLEFPS